MNVLKSYACFLLISARSCHSLTLFSTLDCPSSKIVYKAKLFAKSTMTRLGTGAVASISDKKSLELEMKAGVPVDEDDRATIDVPVLGKMTVGIESVGFIVGSIETYKIGASMASYLFPMLVPERD